MWRPLIAPPPHIEVCPCLLPQLQVMVFERQPQCLQGLNWPTRQLPPPPLRLLLEAIKEVAREPSGPSLLTVAMWPSIMAAMSNFRPEAWSYATNTSKPKASRTIRLSSWSSTCRACLTWTRWSLKSWKRSESWFLARPDWRAKSPSGQMMTCSSSRRLIQRRALYCQEIATSNIGTVTPSIDPLFEIDSFNPPSCTTISFCRKIHWVEEVRHWTNFYALTTTKVQPFLNGCTLLCGIIVANINCKLHMTAEYSTLTPHFTLFPLFFFFV